MGPAAALALIFGYKAAFLSTVSSVITSRIPFIRAILRLLEATDLGCLD